MYRRALRAQKLDGANLSRCGLSADPALTDAFSATQYLPSQLSWILDRRELSQAPLYRALDLHDFTKWKDEHSVISFTLLLNIFHMHCCLKYPRNLREKTSSEKYTVFSLRKQWKVFAEGNAFRLINAIVFRGQNQS